MVCLKGGSQSACASQPIIDTLEHAWEDIDSSNMQNDFFDSLVNPNILTTLEQIGPIWIWTLLRSKMLISSETSELDWRPIRDLCK
jgi:hypothetical protein